MSLLTLIKAQFGKSNTPANNFTLDASADNGTLKLARGNAGATTQDILTVDASGKVSFPQMGQTWQTVTGSRVLGNSYLNDTTQTMIVRVSLTLPTTTVNIQCVTQGVTLLGAAVSTGASGVEYFFIPPGASYVISYASGSGGTLTWQELK